MSWRRISLGEAITHLTDRRIAARSQTYAELPENRNWEGSTEMEAVKFEDGSWLVIEHEPGSPHYSSWTPGSPGHTIIWLGEDA